MEDSLEERIYPTFRISMKGNLKILTIYYRDPGVRDCAFSIYRLKTEKSFKIYYPVYGKGIKPLKIFRKLESANEFCVKKLEKVLENHIGKKV